MGNEGLLFGKEGPISMEEHLSLLNHKHISLKSDFSTGNYLTTDYQHPLHSKENPIPYFASLFLLSSTLIQIGGIENAQPVKRPFFLFSHHQFTYNTLSHLCKKTNCNSPALPHPKQ
jgi:hypothetical protein